MPESSPGGGSTNFRSGSTPPPLPGQPRRSSVPGWAIALIVVGGAFAILFVVGLLAGLLLPALAKAKAKAQEANCLNNLKQVGLAFRTWDIDHGDLYPFNVSTNSGGTLELCSPGADGFDANSWKHLRALSNDLGTPHILVCPADGAHVAAFDVDDLLPANVTYKIHSGTNVDETNPGAILAYCPIHQNFLFADGSVQHATAAQAQMMLQQLARLAAGRGR